jgi:hypothetical protein
MFVQIGNEFKMHHLQALDYNKTGDFKELTQIKIRNSPLSQQIRKGF